MTREEMIAEHDRLCDLDEHTTETLGQIAVLEMALLMSSPMDQDYEALT